MWGSSVDLRGAGIPGRSAGIPWRYSTETERMSREHGVCNDERPGSPELGGVITSGHIATHRISPRPPLDPVFDVDHDSDL